MYFILYCVWWKQLKHQLLFLFIVMNRIWMRILRKRMSWRQFDWLPWTRLWRMWVSSSLPSFFSLAAFHSFISVFAEPFLLLDSLLHWLSRFWLQFTPQFPRPHAVWSILLSVLPFVYPSILPSMNPSVFSSSQPSFRPSIHLSILWIKPSVGPFSHPFCRPSIRLIIHPSFHQFISWSI